MYRYIFFDLDGTLTDSKEGVVNCVRYAAQKLGGPQLDDETVLKFIGPPLQDSFMEFCGFTRPGPGLGGMGRRLREKGYVLALASSKPEELCVSICDRFGFAPYLSATTGSPPDGDWEKADVIREAMRRLGLTETDKPAILMVGDRKFDVLGAKECGIDCAGVEFFGYAAPGAVAQAGAVAVVSNAEELEQFILTH